MNNPHAIFAEQRKTFLRRQAEWNKAMKDLRTTLGVTQALLRGKCHTPVISKKERAQALFAKHKGTRAEMIDIFVRELDMSVAGAKTYCTSVMR